MTETWFERYENPEARRVFEQERLIVWVTNALYEAMEVTGVSKVELAERLGVSRAYVTQLLGGRRNMTLRTLADLAWALGLRADLQLEGLREPKFMCQEAKLVRPATPSFVSTHLTLSDSKLFGVEAQDSMPLVA